MSNFLVSLLPSSTSNGVISTPPLAGNTLAICLIPVPYNTFGLPSNLVLISFPSAPMKTQLSLLFYKKIETDEMFSQ